MPFDTYLQPPWDSATFADRLRPLKPRRAEPPKAMFRWSEAEPDERCEHLIASRAPATEHCNACDYEAHNAWIGGVQERLYGAMEAAAEGRTTDWRVWPTTDEQTIVDEASAEYGFTPWDVRHNAYDPALDGVTSAAESEAFMGALLEELYENPLRPTLIQCEVTDATQGADLADAMPPGDFRDYVRRQIVAAYGPEVFNGPEFSTEPGSYLAARAEADAEYARHKAELPVRLEGAAAQLVAQLAAEGLLPEGCRMEWVDHD